MHYSRRRNSPFQLSYTQNQSRSTACDRSALHGAPHLLALDEAFDKVSTANTQRIIEFLVSQNFQWIMTGPQVSGTGSKIPTSARYLMIHEKGSPVATASTSFWSDQQSNRNTPMQGKEWLFLDI